MTHAAKKIGHGHYLYRGYYIEEVGRYGVPSYGGQAWNVMHEDAQYAHDTFDTLRDAKIGIDYWIDIRDTRA